jgi:hypothetical protein
MSSTRPDSLGEYQDQVEGMIQAGELFRDVEDIINAADLVEDQKAALWLLAWSAREPWVQRQDALAALALVGAAD